MTCVRTDIRTYVHEGLCLHTCDTLDGKWSCSQVLCVHYEIHTGVLLYSVWACMCIMACVNIQRDVYIPGAFKSSANFCATIAFGYFKIESMCSVAQ